MDSLLRSVDSGTTTFAVLIMVGQIGLEPTMVKPADLQSAALAARRLAHFVVFIFWWAR